MKTFIGKNAKGDGKKDSLCGKTLIAKHAKKRKVRKGEWK